MYGIFLLLQNILTIFFIKKDIDAENKLVIIDNFIHACFLL